MKRLRARIAARRLRRHGAELMRRYVRAVEAIADSLSFDACAFAETLCPSLKFHRRRARACARMARRLSLSQTQK